MRARGETAHSREEGEVLGPRCREPITGAWAGRGHPRGARGDGGGAEDWLSQREKLGAHEVVEGLSKVTAVRARVREKGFKTAVMGTPQ
jgi:hypothetical protein